MVYLNDKPIPAPAGASLQEVLRFAGLEPAFTVVTVDGRFVPRSDYKRLRPNEGAKVIARELQDGG